MKPKHIHRIHATGRPALPYSLRNRLIARSRHDGKPAGATGCRPHERNIFPFYEELDWSAQLRKAGYRLWYEPAAVVYHKESMTAKRGSPMREFYLSRARVLFARRNLQGIRKYLSCTYLCILAAPKKAAVYLLHGQGTLAKATLCGTYRGMFVQYR